MEDLQSRALEAGTRQHSVYGVNISFMIVTFIVIVLRMYVRKVLIHAVGVDDSKFTSSLSKGRNK